MKNPDLPVEVAKELQSLPLERCLKDACGALLRWQVGVAAHAEDFWSAETGWIKRPTVSYMCGGFPGDWIRGGLHDEGGTVWRNMGIGPIWHTGQAIKALMMARQWLPEETLRRAVSAGAHFLARLQILEGRNRGAFWTPPHSLPAEWLAQAPSLSVYLMPGKWVRPDDRLANSDMSEAMEGLLMAENFLGDPLLTETCRRWGEWLAREANDQPGHYYHWFGQSTGQRKEANRFWQPDDGVQGLCAVRFQNEDWLQRYQAGVKRCIEWPIDLKEYPAQQARSFYWNASFMFPVIDGRVPGDRDRAVQKLAEYTKWLLGLVEPDGMVGFKYKHAGMFEDPLGTSGDGAGTAMLARMCHMLWKATGDPQWCQPVRPVLRWMVQAQMKGPEAAGVEGAIPFCRHMQADAQGPRFGFKRSISTIFSIMALGEWLHALPPTP